MSDFKNRLIKEQTGLQKKLDRLNSFLMSDKVKTINEVQESLLKVQVFAMATYNQCLKERIGRL